MSKRVKPGLVVPTVKSLEEADSTLALIAARQRELGLLQLGLKEDVDALKLRCAEQCEPIKQEVERLGMALHRFSEDHKEDIFGKKKSRELTFGTLGFQASTTLKTLKKAITWERVLGTLEERGMSDCIRVKKEVDKDALRKLSAERLTEVGCKLVQEDAFFYEVAEVEVAGADSAA